MARHDGATPPTSQREVVVLGTASQAPTRTRNHNGYLVRLGDVGVLVDPGEGTQRQMLLAGVRSSQVTHIAITHHHGDHCLGLPGILQRMVLDQRTDPVTLVHPTAATPFIDRLLGIGLFDDGLTVHRVTWDDDGGQVPVRDGVTLQGVPLRHRVPCLGYRLQEAARPAFVPERLAAVGLAGPAVGRLAREGTVEVDGRVVTLAEVSVPVPGQAVAVVMDTAVCAGAVTAMADADLAVVESTFRDGDEALAETFGHLTAGQAGRLAAEAGVRRLVLTHYSQRYPDAEGFAVQARAHHDDVVAAEDLDRIPLPPRAPRPADV